MLIAAAMAVALLTLLRRFWTYTVRALGRGSDQLGKVFYALLTVFTLPRVQPTSQASNSRLPHGHHLDVARRRSSLRDPLLPPTCRAQAHGQRTSRPQNRDRRRWSRSRGRDCRTFRRSLHEVEILGIFDDRFDERRAIASWAMQNSQLRPLEEFCRRSAVELLLITVPVTAEQRLLHILKRMFSLSVDVRISALSSKLRLSSKAYSYIGNVPPPP